MATLPQANAPGWKGRWLGQMKSKGWPRRFISQKWCCEITSLEIRALSPALWGEGVIHTDDLDRIEKTLGLSDSLLQSCCVRVDNLIFQQKINIPADHSQPAFFHGSCLISCCQLNKITLWLCLFPRAGALGSPCTPLYYTDFSVFFFLPRPASSKCW